MLRQVGPCRRSPSLNVNWGLNKRHPANEPFTTIKKEHTHQKYGPIFGIFLQPDIIESKEQFEKLLLGNKTPEEMAFGETEADEMTFGTPVKIKMNDGMMLRVRQRKYFLV